MGWGWGWGWINNLNYLMLKDVVCVSERALFIILFIICSCQIACNRIKGQQFHMTQPAHLEHPPLVHLLWLNEGRNKNTNQERKFHKKCKKKVIYIINHKRSFALGFWRSPFEVATICFRIGYRSLQDPKKKIEKQRIISRVQILSAKICTVLEIGHLQE